ncbi:MAG: glycoside hydrolase family 127 protein, partial [Alistipes sp.]|nr:glycoside hydrolase family 127 protein [Alistipes sp.]
LKNGTEESLAYEFKRPETVSSVDVYWLDFDHYDGDFRVPEWWKLYYKDGAGKWREVKTSDAYAVEKDRYNTVRFEPVKTRGLKIVAKLQEGVSGGIIEWKVN